MDLFAFVLLVVAGLIVLGTLSFVGHVVGFAFMLPFRILGTLFKLAGFLFALPFLLVALVFTLALGGFGLAFAAGLMLLPLLPFALAIAGLVWLLKRRPHPVH